MQPLFLTSQHLITEHWPSAARLLRRLPGGHGEFTLEDLEEMCREGRAVAGIASDKAGSAFMAIVFEFRHYPRKTVLNVLALAGRDLAPLASTFWPAFRQWAEESGATDIQACVRPAMARRLRALGFEHTYSVVRVSTGEYR